MIAEVTVYSFTSLGGMMRRHHTVKINTAFVKVRRNEMGLTMRVAAGKADISTKHWCNIENERAHPTIVVVVRMANVLKCRPDEFMRSTGEMTLEYLELRLQATIQLCGTSNKKNKKPVAEPLEIKEFLIISKLLGYFDVPRGVVGYDAASQNLDDAHVLAQYENLYQESVTQTVRNYRFLEFIYQHRGRLFHLLSSEKRDQLESYLIDRGVVVGGVAKMEDKHEEASKENP